MSIVLEQSPYRQVASGALGYSGNAYGLQVGTPLVQSIVASTLGEWFGSGHTQRVMSDAQVVGTSVSQSFLQPSNGIDAGFGTAATQNVETYITGAMLFSSASLSEINFGASRAFQPVNAFFAQENHDRFGTITDDEHPNVLQGTNMTPWNPFPIPPPLPRGKLRDRDETRFRKVSSFTRVQPFRVRITRDR